MVYFVKDTRSVCHWRRRPTVTSAMVGALMWALSLALVLPPERGFRILLRERLRAGYSGTAEDAPACAVHRHRHPPRRRSGGEILFNHSAPKTLSKYDLARTTPDEIA